MRQNLIAEAIDHFEDAVRFAKCAKIETDKGKEIEAAQFLAMAAESSSNGEHLIRQAYANSEGAKK